MKSECRPRPLRSMTEQGHKKVSAIYEICEDGARNENERETSTDGELHLQEYKCSICPKLGAKVFTQESVQILAGGACGVHTLETSGIRFHTISDPAWSTLSTGLENVCLESSACPKPCVFRIVGVSTWD